MSRLKTLTDARQEMLTGHPFDIVFSTYDEKRGTGGERVDVKGCVMMRNEEDKREITSPVPKEQRDFKSGRNPRHLLHNSFNVILKNTQVQKVHWLLIEEKDGYKIVL